MKAVLVCIGSIGSICLVMSAIFIFKREGSKWIRFFAGYCLAIAVLLLSSTPLTNGQTYRIENGRPIPVP